MRSDQRCCNCILPTCILPTCRGQGEKIPARTCRYHEKYHGFYEGRVDEHATPSARLETAAAKRQRRSISPPSSFGPSRGASEAELDQWTDVSEPELPSNSVDSNDDSDNTGATSPWSESESEWGGASQSTPSSRSFSHSSEGSDDEDALQRRLQRHVQQQTAAENSKCQWEWRQDSDSDESETDSDDSADQLPQLDPSVHGDLYEKAHVSQGQAVLLIEILADECCLAKSS
ncbi:TPA: hypothetical protein ACH3X2_013266 [Trebouxia sp. C0005]